MNRELYEGRYSFLLQPQLVWRSLVDQITQSSTSFCLLGAEIKGKSQHSKMKADISTLLSGPIFPWDLRIETSIYVRLMCIPSQS